ncbi:4452_t:CDS:2, partial [Funneliformis mosseae]
FIDKMVDSLNDEISFSTVTNVDEGVQWLGYTYLFVRMKNNPLVYGMNYSERDDLDMKEANILSIISQSSEFADLKSREEEAKELERLKKDVCPCQIKQTTDDTITSRIVRALFEIALSRNWAQVSSILLDLCKGIVQHMWTLENPLAHLNCLERL